MRRTEIVATLGSATNTPEALEALVRAGVDVVRLNFSHGTLKEHAHRAQLIRAAAAKVGRTVGILGDLQGPKLRIARFQQGKIILKPGDHFILDASLPSDQGDSSCVGLAYKELVNDVQVGDELWLDDGRVVLAVLAVKGAEIHTKAINGGMLSNNKGLNRRGGGLSGLDKVRVSNHRIQEKFDRIDEAIAMAAMYTANHLGVRAIAALTESGSTPLWMSRISSGIPIYALTTQEATARRVSLYRGVFQCACNKRLLTQKRLIVRRWS